MRKRVLAIGGAFALVAAVAWLSRGTPKQGGEAKAPAAEVTETEQPVLVTKTTQAAGPGDKRTATKAAADAPVFFAKWGGGSGELGRETPSEGNPRGPTSFAVDSNGTMTVLDGVNGRLVRRGSDGKTENAQSLDLVYPEDVAVGADGSTAVLDRFQGKAVSVYDANGNARGKLALAGDGIDDTGSVTGVFVDGKDVYVEREHGPLVKIGDTSGTPAEPRTEIPGRPTRDGLSYLKAGIIEAPVGRVYVTSVERATETHRFTRELRLAAAVHSILLLDADRSGTIYFAAEVQGSTGDPEVVLHCLDGRSGVPTGSAILPANTLPDETFKDFVVLDGGGVMHALRTEAGVSYTRYDCI